MNAAFIDIINGNVTGTGYFGFINIGNDVDAGDGVDGFGVGLFLSVFEIPEGSGGFFQFWKYIDKTATLGVETPTVSIFDSAIKAIDHGFIHCVNDIDIMGGFKIVKMHGADINLIALVDVVVSKRIHVKQVEFIGRYDC